MNQMIRNLGNCNLFAGITLGELEAIFGKAKHRIAKFLPGEIIQEQGSICDELLVLLTGEIKAQMQDYSGKVLKIETIAAPTILASGFLFAKDNRLPVDIVALENVAILYISKKDVFKICMEHEKFLVNLLSDMGDRLSLLANKVWSLSLETLRQKLARFLIKEAREKGPVFELSVTKEELAETFGVARPSLSRVFGDFVASGIINHEGRRIEVTDMKELERILSVVDSQER
jgi:CRP-like cAMP-binding protein